MNHRAISVFAFVALISSVAHAQKSARQCEKEVGNVTGEERTRKMTECLLAHAKLPKPEPRGTFYVRSLGIHVNSAGGVEPEVTLVNPNRASAIKYLSLDFDVYNRVGDKVFTGKGPTTSVRFTGPLGYEDEPKAVGWSPITYAAAASCITIKEIVVQFMNGKFELFQGPEVSTALHPSVKNDCRLQTR